MVIEVSDLYDAFYKAVQVAWSAGEFAACSGAPPRSGMLQFHEYCDVLEQSFFYAACARRLGKLTGYLITPMQVRTHLKLHDANGIILDDIYEQQYQYHAFDWGTPDHADIENRIAAGNLTPKSRDNTRVFLHFDDPPPVLRNADPPFSSCLRP